MCKDKYEEDLTAMTAVLLFMAIGGLLGLSIGGCFHSQWKSEFRRDAVKAGVAEWVVNENGSTDFRFKEVAK